MRGGGGCASVVLANTKEPLASPFPICTPSPRQSIHYCFYPLLLCCLCPWASPSVRTHTHTQLMVSHILLLTAAQPHPCSGGDQRRPRSSSDTHLGRLVAGACGFRVSCALPLQGCAPVEVPQRGRAHWRAWSSSPLCAQLGTAPSSGRLHCRGSHAPGQRGVSGRAGAPGGSGGPTGHELW